MMRDSLLFPRPLQLATATGKEANKEAWTSASARGSKKGRTEARKKAWTSKVVENDGPTR
jgi:hypothetical protein